MSKERGSGGFDPDKEWDLGNRYPAPPKMPDEIKSDPKKKKQWNEYWEKAKNDWSDYIRDQKNKEKRRD